MASEKKVVHNIKSLNKRIEALEDQIEILLAVKEQRDNPSTKREANSIQRVEDFNGEDIPVPEEKMKMNSEDKQRSMENAIRILPPNYVKEGRHSVQNVKAVCGFDVSPEMMDELYSRNKHEDGLVVSTN